MNESHLKTLRTLASNPKVSQRDIARELDLSLGKVNYILKALMENGLVKMKRFKDSNSKLAYMYILTPDGIKMRVRLTSEFIKRKSQDYEALKAEIAQLKNEMDHLGPGS